MGRQAYITRLALGRSAFEEPDSSWEQQHAIRVADKSVPESSSPESAAEEELEVQQYDSRGHPTNPASRAQARSLIRAQNDVLVTVGVCVERGSHDDSGALQQLHDTASRNNARTNRFYRADSMLNFAATWWISAVKHRLLAFTPLWRLPLPYVLRHQYQSFGARDFFSAGLLSSSVNFFASTEQDDALYWISRSIYRQLSFPLLSERERRTWDRVMSVAEPMLKLGGFIVFAPFKVYGILQLLGFISPFPLLPGPHYYKVFYSHIVFSSLALSGDWSVSSVIARSLECPLLWLLLDWYLMYPLACTLFAQMSQGLVKLGFLEDLLVDSGEMGSIQSTPQPEQDVTGAENLSKLDTFLHTSSRSFHAVRYWLIRRLRPRRTWDDLCATGLGGLSRSAREHGIAVPPARESAQPLYNHGGVGFGAEAGAAVSQADAYPSAMSPLGPANDTAATVSHNATAHQASATGPDGQATTHNQPSAVIRRRIVSVSPFPYLFTRRLSWHLLDLVLSPLNYFLVRSITLSYIRTAETRGVEMSTPFAASFRCVPLSALRDVGLAGRSSTARGALNFLGCVAVHMTVSMGMLELMFRGYSWFTQTPPRWTRIIDVRK